MYQNWEKELSNCAPSSLTFAYVNDQMVTNSKFKVHITIYQEANSFDFMDYGAITKHFPVHVIIFLRALLLFFVFDNYWNTNIVIHQSAYKRNKILE